eukprot:TRINITY_DN19283_c0_g1_i2.p1 TRINITY_DN19283_c0_g1~~TRINITY_DN19283_c0_g1_i2.p1  ORF type:complete len:208 (+),score=21.48 TRINITY_DN19283_c0_g1_i2:117-740(+)
MLGTFNITYAQAVAAQIREDARRVEKIRTSRPVIQWRWEGRQTCVHSVVRSLNPFAWSVVSTVEGVLRALESRKNNDQGVRVRIYRAEVSFPDLATARETLRALLQKRRRPPTAAAKGGELAAEGEEVSEEICSVCLDALRSGDLVWELPCSHKYHAACACPWLQSHASCPMCRCGLEGKTIHHRFVASETRVPALPCSGTCCALSQ